MSGESVIYLHPPESTVNDGVEIIPGTKINPEPIMWLWDGWLAAGKLHILPGPPGTGKTTLAAAIAATLTTGGRWPDGARAKPGNVLIWSGEDDPKDTLVPRLLACGADLSRIFFIGETTEGGEVRAFDPATDFIKMAVSVEKIQGGVALLIVDPIVSAVAGDSHKNAEVRRSLQPLVTLAAGIGAAILGITHFSKSTGGRDPVERVNGSIAFGALARVVFAAAKMPEDDQEGGGRVFCRSKSNIGPDSGGFRYDLEQVELDNHPGVTATRIMWGAPVEGSARELLARADALPDSDDAEPKRPDANAEWLKTLLSRGGMNAADIQKEAREAGISDKQLRTAREKLGIEPKKMDFSKGWRWELPSTNLPQDALLQDAHISPNKKTRASWAPSLEAAPAVASSGSDLENHRAPWASSLEALSGAGFRGVLEAEDAQDAQDAQGDEVRSAWAGSSTSNPADREVI